LLPDAELEIENLRRACDLAPRGVTLAKLRDWFEQLPATDAARTQMLSPPEGLVERLPMLARFLRGSLALEAVAAQLSILGVEMSPRLSPHTPLSTLEQTLSGEAFRQALAKARKTVQTASAQAGSDDIQAVVKRLCSIPDRSDALLARSDGDVELSAQVVLVIDQFEQLFTLGKTETRTRVFQTLATLVAAQAPVHIVLSLRKEWYADLVQQFTLHLRISESLAKITFYLEPMTRPEAEQVMVEAPQVARTTAIEPSQRKALWLALQHDDTIDAVVLSIACHELFAAGEAAQSAIGEAGVEGLLRAYLSRAIDAITDEADREEAFDILGQIAGAGETRNFVEHNSLLNAPLRDRERRIRVLDYLQRAFLIKGDSPRRGFDKVYDVMHERLLSPLRELIARRSDVALFREAAERVELEDASERGLNWRYCQALLTGSHRAVWNSRAAGILLSSLVRELDPERLAALQRCDTNPYGPVPQGTRPIDWLRSKFRELADASAKSPDPTAISVADRARLSWWMTEKEIAARVDARPDEYSDLLALRSGLQGPSGWMRQELEALAVRFGGTGAPI
jgi:hypothetical protein